MISRKFKTIGALCACSVTAVAVVFASGKTFGAIKASGTEKTFSFDKDVASQVPYDGAYQTVRSVTTGISTPILTRFYRSEGNASEYSSRNGCFCSFDYANRRTHVFEAGVNNLIGFELKAHFSFDPVWGTTYSAFTYNATLTFYEGNNVVGEPINFSCNSVVTGQEYIHQWSKTTETEKIDKVVCAFSVGGGSSHTDWCQLFLDYFKLTWNC